MRSQIAPVAALACAIACGGTSSNNAGAVDDLGVRLGSALCSARAACGIADPGCTGSAIADALVGSDVVALVHAGRIAYDADLGDACVARIGSAACDSDDPELRFWLRRESDPATPPAGSDDPCDLMFTGTLAGGTACEASAECATAPRLTYLADDRCQFKAGCSPPGCSGECIPQQDCGAPCHHDQECAPNLYCSAVGACQLPFESGDTCDTPSGCVYPSTCEDILGGQGTCSSPGTPAATGDACTPDTGCANVVDCCGSGSGATCAACGSD